MKIVKALVLLCALGTLAAAAAGWLAAVLTRVFWWTLNM